MRTIDIGISGDEKLHKKKGLKPYKGVLCEGLKLGLSLLLIHWDYQLILENNLKLGTFIKSCNLKLINVSASQILASTFYGVIMDLGACLLPVGECNAYAGRSVGKSQKGKGKSSA